MNINKTIWLSVHIFYFDPFEKLLTELVNNMVCQLKESKLIIDYFFIRYWEKGPHIRLRLKVDNTVDEKILKRQIQKYCDNYFSLFPSKDKEKLYEDETILKNNSIYFINYLPELERYGGSPESLECSESHFINSSKTVISAIMASNKWSYEEALSTALKLHVIFFYEMSVNGMNLIYFEKIIYNNWFPLRRSRSVEGLTKKQIIDQTNKLNSLYHKSWKNQRASIEPALNQLWSQLKSNIPFEEDWVNSWRSHCIELKKKLLIIQKKIGFKFPAYFSINNELPVSIKEQELWVLYRSYLHMLNNRLGIVNNDESYLAFIIYQGLLDKTLKMEKQ